MAITIVEELWGRIRAHIDDKIAAATAASESAVAAKTAAEAAAIEVQGMVADAATVAAAAIAAEMQDLTGRAETAATTATTAVATEVEKLKGDAPEAFDTLGEIAAELAANETERSALTNSIAAKADKVHDHTVEQVTGLQGELDGKAPVSHTHTALQISDATTVGRSVLTASSQATARSAIGAGTSNLALGTTSSTAKAGNYQPTAADISDATTVGRDVIKAADAAAARTAIGAGTSNLALGTTSSTAAAGNHTHSQYATTTTVDTKVTGSTSGMELWSGTQAQYDALPSATRTRAGFVAVIY